MKLKFKERGSVISLTVIFMAVILACAALAVDFGAGVVMRSRLRAVADSAALAGAAELPESGAAARETALDYCMRHSVFPGEVTVSIGESFSSIRVRIDRLRTVNFAKIFGSSEGRVVVESEAGVGIIGGFNGVIPIGVEEREFTYGTPYKLKLGAGQCEKDNTPSNCSNFGPVALGGTGASLYEYNFINGYKGRIYVGQWISTEPGNMVGPTRQSVRNRIDSGPGETYNNYPLDSRRLVYVPIIETLNVAGRDEVLVVGFAAFFLEDTGGQGEVYGRFIKRRAPGVIMDGIKDFNLHAVRLTM